jgi:hypothetical protein
MSRRSTFRLGKYCVVDNAPQDRIVVSKGGVVKTIDLSDLRNRIKRLRQNYNLEVRNLTGKLADDYSTLLAHVTLLYDTNEYNVLYNEIKKIFGDVVDPADGTIGAYCAKCLNVDGRSCSVICSGVSAASPIPKPKSENGLQFCENSVLWASFVDGGYKFTDMNQKENKKDTVIYLESPVIHGINQEERNYLKSLGVERVQLIHIPPDGKEYREINNGFLELEKLPPRNAIVTPKNTEPKQVSKETTPVEAKPEKIIPIINGQPVPVVPTNTVKAVEREVLKTRETTPGSTSKNLIFFLVLIAVIVLILAMARKH